MKFAHEAVICKQKGKLKVYCRCGVQSKKLSTEAEAQEAYTTHLDIVGIREKKAKLVMS